MGQKKLIRNARAIVSCDALDTVYYDSDVLIEGYQIKQIGKNLSSEGCEIIDGSSYFIHPGLVNTHHHFFQDLCPQSAHHRADCSSWK